MELYGNQIERFLSLNFEDFMDKSVFITTFLTIFVAEIGDKTQFAAFALASQEKSVGTILFATVLALSLAAILGVFFGSLLGRFIDPEKMRYISGISFVLMGVWIFIKK